MLLHTTEFMVTYVEDEDEGYIISAYIFHMKRDLERLRTFVRLFFPTAHVDKLRDAYHFPDANYVTLPPDSPGLPQLKVIPDLTDQDSYILFPAPGYYGNLTLLLHGRLASLENVLVLEEIGFTSPTHTDGEKEGEA
jgi:hypothetical protein